MDSVILLIELSTGVRIQRLEGTIVVKKCVDAMVAKHTHAVAGFELQVSECVSMRGRLRVLDGHEHMRGT